MDITATKYLYRLARQCGAGGAACRGYLLMRMCFSLYPPHTPLQISHLHTLLASPRAKCLEMQRTTVCAAIGDPNPLADGVRWGCEIDVSSVPSDANIRHRFCQPLDRQAFHGHCKELSVSAEEKMEIEKEDSQCLFSVHMRCVEPQADQTSTVTLRVHHTTQADPRAAHRRCNWVSREYRISSHSTNVLGFPPHRSRP